MRGKHFRSETGAKETYIYIYIYKYIHTAYTAYLTYIATNKLNLTVIR